MKYVATINGKKYEVEVEKLEAYKSLDRNGVAAPAAPVLPASAPVQRPAAPAPAPVAAAPADGKWYGYSGWNEKSDQWRSFCNAQLDRSSTDGTPVHLQNDGCNDVW
mgnify:CR=1 FL=1